MNSAFLSTVLTLALGLALAIATVIGVGDGGPPSPGSTIETSSNRELERRLDLVVNGSGPRVIASRRVTSGAPADSAERLTIRTVTTVLSPALLGGLLILIRQRLVRSAQRRRVAFATASSDSRLLVSRTG